MIIDPNFKPPKIAEIPPTNRRWSHDKITLMSLGPKKERVRITFSKNIILGLVEYYDATWMDAVFWRDQDLRLNYIRLQIAPFYKLRMPGAFIRVHPRHITDEGPGVTLHRRNQNFFIQLAGRKLGFRRRVKTKTLDFAWAPYGFGGHGGLVLWFDDEDIKVPSVKTAMKFPKGQSLVLGMPKKENGNGRS